MHRYPLRFSRNHWKIPLYCYHECNESCSSIIQINEDNLLSIIDNPNCIEGKCERYNELIPTSIHISSYTIHSPYGEYGKLYNPNLIVIPDLEFTICITFPLNNPANVKIVCNKESSLRELLLLIRNVYSLIYQYEEETADPTSFEINEECSCTKDDLTQYIHSIPYTTSDNCSICYMNFENEACELNCKHVFHKECINSWITKGNGKNCPLCRSDIKACIKCSNTGSIITTQEHVVLPMELRTNQNRNDTNGYYNIYSYDLNILKITSLYYNRVNKILKVNTGYL